jgi:aldehyde dehydrogenase (NAD+)
VMATAARTLTPVTLELGGKSPVVVTADADVDVAARRIALVKLLNAGQTCLAPDYVLADRTVRDRLVERLTKAVADFTADRPDGLPVRDAREADRLAGLLSATKGTVVTGGTTGGSTGGGRTVRPTVVVDPDPEEPLMRQEIFGPVLPVLAYDDLEEAIDFVVSRPKPLAAYAFTGSKEVAGTLIDRLPGGAVVINHLGVHSMVPQLPFGGVGASGTGTYHGEWGFRTLSHPKAVLRKPTRPDPSLLYPPYSDRAFRLLRRLL